MKTIAIIGAGYSGTLCAVNLLRKHTAAGLSIKMFDRHTRFGRGLAYRTWDDNFVLNVPAGNMSVFPDEPGHFVSYCQSIDPAFNAGSFVSRRVYGDYLELTLQQEIEARPDVMLERVQADVISVRPNQPDHGSAGFQITTAYGDHFSAAQVVLAFGHFAPVDPPPVSDFYQSSGYIGNPWDFPAIDHIHGDAPVALIGAAHTAIDVLFRLTSHSEGRKIYLISRRGLSLQSHRPHPQSPTVAGFPSFFENVEPTVRQYFRALRRHALERVAQGGDWRDVMNSLRPYTLEIWQRFPVKERRRFLSKVVAYWDIHRHRLAPVAHLRLNQMLKSGQVETVAGHVHAYDVDGDMVTMHIRERGDDRIRHLSVCRVVNCTGPSYDIDKINTPLVVQLRTEGYLQQDPLKLGFEVDERYCIIDQCGNPVENLFYVGPMLKARYWEAIAIPELRTHTRRLVEVLLTE